MCARRGGGGSQQSPPATPEAGGFSSVSTGLNKQLCTHTEAEVPLIGRLGGSLASRREKPDEGPLRGLVSLSVTEEHLPQARSTCAPPEIKPSPEPVIV